MTKMRFWRCKEQSQSSAGKSLPDTTTKLTECYAAIDQENLWQGDLFSSTDFAAGSIPKNVPYWMIINRTCHLYSKGSRKIKLEHLNYCAVYPLRQFVDYALGAQNLKNQVSQLIKKSEEHVFLPQDNRFGVNEPLVANFNLLNTVRRESTPPASKKILQLSSPFSEHVFQKLARYFYTVGFEDEQIKSDENISNLVDFLERNRPKTH